MDGEEPAFDIGDELEDRVLDRLVRRAFERARPTFRLPGVEAVTAYLDGNANEAQRLEVRRALLDSPAFRSEYLGLVRPDDV